jgi:hypothetical protein
MAKPQTGGGTKKGQVETRPAGWARFEKAVDAAVKSGPKHRTSAQPMAQDHKVKDELKAGKTRRAVVAADTVRKNKAVKPPSR